MDELLFRYLPDDPAVQRIAVNTIEVVRATHWRALNTPQAREALLERLLNELKSRNELRALLRDASIVWPDSLLTRLKLAPSWAIEEVMATSRDAELLESLIDWFAEHRAEDPAAAFALLFALSNPSLPLELFGKLPIGRIAATSRGLVDDPALDERALVALLSSDLTPEELHMLAPHLERALDEEVLTAEPALVSRAIVVILHHVVHTTGPDPRHQPCATKVSSVDEVFELAAAHKVPGVDRWYLGLPDAPDLMPAVDLEDPKTAVRLFWRGVPLPVDVFARLELSLSDEHDVGAALGDQLWDALVHRSCPTWVARSVLASDPYLLRSGAVRDDPAASRWINDPQLFAELLAASETWESLYANLTVSAVQAGVRDAACLLALSSSALGGVNVRRAELIPGLGELLQGRLGTSPSAWATVFGLLDDWQGSLGELLDSATGLSNAAVA
jgi:hypothetical protein